MEDAVSTELLVVEMEGKQRELQRETPRGWVLQNRRLGHSLPPVATDTMDQRHQASTILAPTPTVVVMRPLAGSALPASVLHYLRARYSANFVAIAPNLVKIEATQYTEDATAQSTRLISLQGMAVVLDSCRPSFEEICAIQSLHMNMRGRYCILMASQPTGQELIRLRQELFNAIFPSPSATLENDPVPLESLPELESFPLVTLPKLPRDDEIDQEDNVRPNSRRHARPADEADIIARWIARLKKNEAIAKAINGTKYDDVKQLLVEISKDELDKLQDLDESTPKMEAPQFRLPSNPDDRILSVEWKKTFPSQAQPMLLNVVLENQANRLREDRKVIFKVSDDPNIDIIAMHLSKLFNQIWEAHGLEFSWYSAGQKYSAPVRNVVYEIHPLSLASTRAGFILVNAGRTMFDIWDSNGLLNLNTQVHGAQYSDNAWNSFTPDSFAQFVASAVAMFVTGYVLRYGDRHQSNMMRSIDGTVFHIDLQKILNEKTLVEASRWPLPYGMVSALKYHGCYESFLALCGQAIYCLSLYKPELLTAMASIANSPALNRIGRECLDVTLTPLSVPAIQSDLESWSSFAQNTTKFAVHWWESSKSNLVKTAVPNVVRKYFKSKLVVD